MAVELDPSYAPQFHAETARDRLGRAEESDLALERLKALPGSDAALRVAEVHALRDDVEASFRWLETGRERAVARPGRFVDPVWLMDLALSPFLKPLHEDRRWERLMAEADDLSRAAP